MANIETGKTESTIEKEVEIVEKFTSNGLSSSISNYSTEKSITNTISIGSAIAQAIIEVSNIWNEIFTERIQPVVEKIVEFQSTYSGALIELVLKFNDLKENPNSLLNHYTYAKKLNEFMWTMPFGISSEHLKVIIERVSDEKSFDKEMAKYFKSEKVMDLCIVIKQTLPRKHYRIFNQIVSNVTLKNYAISNVGVLAIIDDLCTFFIIDKQINARQNLLLPIIDELDGEVDNLFTILPLMILNENLNTIYEYVNFNEQVKIKTNKKARRNPCQHGKSISNKKIDCIMLLNTLYYLLCVRSDYKKYKNTLVHVRKENDKSKKFYLAK